MFNKTLILTNGSTIEVPSILDHQYNDAEVVVSFDEFLQANDSLLSPGWHQLTDKMLVVVSNIFLFGRWKNLYQVICTGAYGPSDHKLLLQKMYGWS
jgi:hypothetical protein